MIYKVAIIPDKPIMVWTRRPMMSNMKLPRMAMAKDQHCRMTLICVCVWTLVMPACVRILVR